MTPTLALVMALPFAAGAALATLILWPLAHRAGKRAEQRDQAEIARILGGVHDAPPAVRQPIEWRRPEPTPAVAALTAPTAAHASLRVATTPADYRPRHTAALVLAHLKADAYIGRPRQAVAS